MDGVPLTLPKAERLCSMTLIDRLFNESGSRSMSAFPLRAVFTTVEKSEVDPSVRVLISVPKRKLHHAVDRNRVKRQLRESYRKRKLTLLEAMEKNAGKSLLVAFVWLDDKVRTSADVDRSMRNLLNRISEAYESA